MPITLDQFAEKMKLLTELEQSQQANRILVVTMDYIRGAMLERIFDEGLDTDGTQIASSYTSKKKKYVKEDFDGIKGSAGFSPDTVIKRKTATGGTIEVPAMLFENYAAFRKHVGRQTAYVDLQLSGSLKGNILLGESDGKVIIGLTSAEEAKKRALLEAMYKKDIFKPSKKEIEEGGAQLVEEIKAIIRGRDTQ